MCKKKQFKYCPSKIDECMVNLITILNAHHIKTLGCCCGHGKYNMSIIILCRDGKTIVDLVSNKIIPRTKRFYKKDKQGYYYIPEIMHKTD